MRLSQVVLPSDTLAKPFPLKRITRPASPGRERIGQSAVRKIEISARALRKSSTLATMAKQRKIRETPAERTTGGGVLERLSAAEAASVLKRVLGHHPELRSEAETLAGDVLSEVSILAIADDVEAAVLQFDYDDLNARAGRHSWGYVEPTEAAWELLEEAVTPFVDNMKRYLEIGLEGQARLLCQGIVLGLYRVRGGGNDILSWAPDFPAEEAGFVLDAWGKGGKTGEKGGRQLSRDFTNEHIPEWQWAAKPTEESL